MSASQLIAVVGSINVDLIAQVRRHPQPGETLHGRGGTMLPGGKGANQAVAAARLGGRVRMIGAVGTDAQAEVGLSGLRGAGVDLAGVREVEGPTGLAIVTEVMAPEHVELVAEYADVLQIGARNMQNYQLLQAVGDSGKPTLLKRGMSATIEEFLLAAEYILDRGNPNVVLCERGIRTYEDHTRFTLPLATVPYLNEKSHLPVVVDPSHGTGKSSLVASMSKAAAVFAAPLSKTARTVDALRAKQEAA